MKVFVFFVPNVLLYVHVWIYLFKALNTPSVSVPTDAWVILGNRPLPSPLHSQASQCIPMEAAIAADVRCGLTIKIGLESFASGS